MFGVGFPNNDPYLMTQELPGREALKDPRGRTIKSPLIVAGETTGVFIVAGQSLADSSVNATYSPTNASKIDEINVFDGGCYQAADPMIGASAAGAAYGCFFLRLADKMIIAGKFQRIILVPIAMGGSSITDWAPGGIYHLKLLAAPKRVIAAGIPLNAISAVLWQQGETDASNSMLQATYKANHDAMTTAFRALHGNIRWFLAKSTTINYAPIRSAVDQIVAAGPQTFAGADTDTITGGTNRYDSVHPTATGADAMSSLWVTALSAVF